MMKIWILRDRRIGMERVLKDLANGDTPPQSIYDNIASARRDRYLTETVWEVIVSCVRASK